MRTIVIAVVLFSALVVVAADTPTTDEIDHSRHPDGSHWPMRLTEFFS